jgi:membrane protein
VAVGLTIVVGAMLVSALLLAVGGTRIGLLVADSMGMYSALTAAWPLIHWVAVVGFAGAGVEMLYCMAPNLKQRPMAQIPGVIVAVMLWLVSSASLGAYLRQFGHLTAINATVGSVSALMLWCFFSSLAILIGAEVNSQAKIIRAQHGKSSSR